MTVIGLETSTEVCSVGLIRNDEAWERTIRESRVHSERLLDLLDEVLSEAGVGVKDADAVAVSGGPGSFTGLRIGVSAAKGLAAATGCAFIAVPTGKAIAETGRRLRKWDAPFVLALDAKNGEWYVIRDPRAGGEQSPKLLNEEEVSAAAKGEVVVSDVPGRFAQIARETVDVHTLCSGTSVARVAATMLAVGIRHDIGSYEPQYVKDFVVRTRQRTGTSKE